jgi:hypothetical protein
VLARKGTRGGARLATIVLAAVIAVLQVAIGHHPVLEANGNLASLAEGRTAWAGLVQGVFLLAAGALWLAAVIRQALSWRRSGGERRQQLKWLASGAGVCGVLGISAVSTNSSIWEVLPSPVPGAKGAVEVLVHAGAAVARPR